MGFGGRKAAAKPMVFPGGSEEGVRVSGSKQSFPHSIPHLRVYRMSRAVRRTGLGGEALSTGPVGRSCGPAPSIPWTAKPERGGTGAAPGGDGERAGGRGGPCGHSAAPAWVLSPLPAALRSSGVGDGRERRPNVLGEVGVGGEWEGRKASGAERFPSAFIW